MNRKVLIGAPVHPVLTEGLQELGYELISAPKIDQSKAFELIRDCEGVITSARLNLNKELLDAAPKLKWIGRMGSGMEVIDTVYATQKGIIFFSSPEGNCNAVAEHALGMLLNLTKRITWSRNEIVVGKWLREENRGTELEGKTIGIIGFGHTGRAFAKKLQGFDMQILVYDIVPQQNVPDYVTICSNLDPIFEQATIISFHVPLEDSTRNYFNQKFFEKITQDFTLLNTSRGEIVVTEVLKEGLGTGKIKGAGLDVWREEPLERMSEWERTQLKELIQLPQVIITPHIAGYTFEALHKMSKTLLEKIIKNQLF